MIMMWNSILYGIMTVTLVTVFITCGLACMKMFRREPETTEGEDEEEHQVPPVEELNDETEHITRDSLRHVDSDEETIYDEFYMYNMMTGSFSLASSGKGDTMIDRPDYKHVEDGSVDDTDEAGPSDSQDDSGIKSNAGDEKRVYEEEGQSHDS